MRKSHYWKAAKRTAAPSNVCVFDTEAWHGAAARCDEGERQTWRLGCAMAYRLEGGRRTRTASLKTTDQAALLPFIVSRLDRNRPLWLIGHNVAYDLQIAGLWGVLCSERFMVSHAAVSPGTTYLKGRFDGKPIVIADTFNYWKTTLRDLGEELGVPKLPMPPVEAPDADWLAYCWRDVEATAAAFDSLVAFVRGHDLGPWAATTAGLSFNALRHRFLPCKVLVHDNKPALELERASYFGGITDCNYVGMVREHKLYELDVQSMYPSCCLGEMPTRIAGFSRKLGPKALKQLMGQYLACAEVTIYTQDATYPVRHGKRVIYPRGLYSTSLADPELREALRLGHVEQVHRAAWYHKAPAFREYMQFMLSLRAGFKARGLKAQELMAKMLANSLYGKVGQRNVRWERWGEDALKRIEELHGLPDGELSRIYDKPPRLARMEGAYIIPQAGLVLKVRDYWGYVEVSVDRGESRDSCPVMAACVTSEARLLLRSIQREAGARHWYYSDTDSIWCDAVGFARLSELGWVQDGGPGRLRVKGEYGRLVIHAPKDYECDGRVIVKGAKDSAVWVGPADYEQDSFPSANSILRDHAKPGVLVGKIRRHLARGLDRCTVGPDGWTAPLELDSPKRAARYIPLDVD